MKLMTCLFWALALSLASAQYVTFGPTDPNYCANMRVKANLHVPCLVKLKGKVRDQAGAAFENSVVELRRFNSETKQTTIAKAKTDSKGYFDLGEVKPDNYRFLGSPTRAFKQPSELWCGSDAECFLEITLQANPTDQPDSQCPSK